MQTSTVTTKGQVTIPAKLRRQLGIRRGDEVAFFLEDAKVIMVPVKKDIKAAFGLVQATRSVSLKAMEEAIRRRANR